MNMPAPNGVSIPVHVNFNGISYDPTTQQWTIPAGAPTWNVPATVAVASGNNLLTWSLTGTQLPEGFVAQFDPSDGIAFATGWTGGEPYMIDNETIQCTDDFTASSDSPSYYYSITVNLVQTAGSASHPFRLDPDIKNRGTGPMIMHVTVASGAAVTAD
jgi:hypothetical protein